MIAGSAGEGISSGRRDPEGTLPAESGWTVAGRDRGAKIKDAEMLLATGGNDRGR